MSPQEHAAAIKAAAEQLRLVVQQARQELPVSRAKVLVAAMEDTLEDFQLLQDDLKEVLTP